MLDYSDNIFANEIQVEMEEDIIRFQLLPDLKTELARVSQNNLRTRRTLSVQRLEFFVKRKLDDDNLDLKIFCKDSLVEPYQTLGEIQEEIWKDDTVLTLRYKLSSELEEEEEQLESAFVKLPVWDDAMKTVFCTL